MDDLNEERLRLRYGLALRKLLKANLAVFQSHKKKEKDDPFLIYTLGGLSAQTSLRKATLSAIFNGNSFPNGKSLYLILEGLGYSFADFGEIFDAIEEKEIEAYAIEVKKSARKMTRNK